MLDAKDWRLIIVKKNTIHLQKKKKIFDYLSIKYRDISKKILLTRVSCPDKSICQVIPVRLFSQREEDLHNVIEQMTLRSFQAGGNDLTFPGEDDVCVLVLASSDPECSRNHPVKELHMTPGRWRLALMAKKTFEFGAILDSRCIFIY